MSAVKGLMHFKKEEDDHYVRVKHKFIVSILDSFHEAIYPDAKLLVFWKNEVSLPTEINLENPWAKTFGWI